MAIGVIQIHHIQIFVPREVEQETKHFYGTLLGLQEIPKPEAFRKNGGAWYQHGPNELHLSLESMSMDNHSSRRHVCYMVEDLGHAEKVLREAGVEILPDTTPFDQWKRFYARDPGGNRIEIAQR
jgi:catechol 2,3-dioxygenase-like lactoylglutathione lyase family enzyme